MNKIWDKFWAKQSTKEVKSYGLRIKLIERNINPDGLKTLEVGSGSGADSVQLAARSTSVTCLDNSEKAISLSKKLFKEQKQQGNFIIGDAFNLCFKDNSFDIVFNAGLIEHFKDPSQIIQEMKRVSRKYVMVWVPQKYHPYTIMKHQKQKQGTWEMGWETEYTFFQLKKLLERNGLKVVDFVGSAPAKAPFLIKKFLGIFIGLEAGMIAEV